MSRDAIIDIDADAVVVFTNKLEKLHRSALPSAVRGTLNKAAFDVKQKTMPATSARTFTMRQANFFKANSRVDVAKGFDIGSMQSTVGFTEQSLKGQNNYAVRDLEQQERGGTIKSRAFIPTNIARGGSSSKPVRPGNRLAKVKNIVNSNGFKGTKKQQFKQAAEKAGAGGYVIGNSKTKILWRIDSISVRNGRLKVRKTPLYSFQDNRSVSVKGTGFMERASLQSGDKLNDFYIQEATRQIEKLMK